MIIDSNTQPSVNVYPNGGFMGNGGFGGFDGGNGSWFWVIILFFFAIFGGWGGNGYGNGGAQYAPYYGAEVRQGFDQAALVNGINGIQNTLVANQNANTANMNALGMSLQNCCCENRLATAELRYTVANEACADRAAVGDALQAVTAQNNANTQRILDQMCADKIDAKNEKIADLQNQLTMAQLAASQNAQTAAILANNEAQTAALEQYLSPVPRPAYVVQNPNCCGNYYTSGCGCGR